MQEEKIKINRIVILPGNGCTPIAKSNWYYWLYKELCKQFPSIKVMCEDMPDPFIASENIWIPFTIKQLGCDENTLLIGHSSGAAAAMRLLENNTVKSVILVSAYWTDQGDKGEAASGYFNRTWEWDRINHNTKKIIQLGSTNDPLVPFEEQEYVHDHLNSEFIKYTDQGHFMFSKFPQLLRIITDRFTV